MDGLEGYARSAKELRERYHGDVVTYSRNIFLPVTNICRNACAYCGFRRGEEEGNIMNEGEVRILAENGVQKGCKEALFTFGEGPEKYRKMKSFLKAHKCGDFVEYVTGLCKEVASLGLLPHTNAGVLSFEDLKRLKVVNASMGLMLESASERLMGRGMPHELSPGKAPELRLKTIGDAGKLGIPFTTGLLIGIGETEEEIVDSLLELKRLQEKYNHIQEIIIQGFVPKQGTPMEKNQAPDVEKMLKTVVATRLLFKDVSVQVPPNLAGDALSRFLDAGASDLGGISPLTVDYINPESAWPEAGDLKKIVEDAGLVLRERLPIYPEFIKREQYPYSLEKIIGRYAGEDGLVG